MKKLLIVSLVAFILMGCEVVGGYIAQSLAIMTDAAHMFSDFAGFFISIFSIWLARKPSTMTLTYGFHRAEIIGALVSVIIIWGLTIWLFVEAI
jgi:zinc transporter 2